MHKDEICFKHSEKLCMTLLRPNHKTDNWYIHLFLLLFVDRV